MSLLRIQSFPQIGGGLVERKPGSPPPPPQQQQRILLLLHPFRRFGFGSTTTTTTPLSTSTVSSRKALQICCSGFRKAPIKRNMERILSTEAIHAVQCIKLAKSNEQLEDIFSSRVGRLLKKDVLAVLEELQRQNEIQLAFKVFEFIREEVWYKPDLSLYSDMILMFGRNKMIGIAEELFFRLRKEGLEPDTRTYTEMIGAFLRVDMITKAMSTYQSMKESGCAPDKLTLTILIRNLEKAGEDELASRVKKDCVHLPSPNKFLEEVAKKYPKKKRLNLV